MQCVPGELSSKFTMSEKPYIWSLCDANIKMYCTEKNGVGFTTIFTHKLLVNFTNNYKDMASNIELNVKF